jgi:hypothetical protein
MATKEEIAKAIGDVAGGWTVNQNAMKKIKKEPQWTFFYTEAVKTLTGQIAKQEILTPASEELYPEHIPNGLKAKAISVGDGWGLILGEDNVITQVGTRILPKNTRALDIACAKVNAYIIKEDGTVQGFGPNENNQIDIPVGHRAAQLSAGGTHLYTIANDGSASLFGQDSVYTGNLTLPLVDIPLGVNIEYKPEQTPDPTDALFTPANIPNGFEIIVQPVQRKSNFTPAHLTVIPKGTILFYTKSDEKEFKVPLRGEHSGGNIFTIHPHSMYDFSVFPVGMGEIVGVFKLLRDVKLVSLISPGVFCMNDTKIPDLFFEKKHVLGLALREDFRKYNRSVVGFIAIPEEYKNTGAKEYASMYTDSHSLIPGFPILRLYPHKSHISGSVNRDGSAEIETDDMNYNLIDSFPNTPEGKHTWMNAVLSPDGNSKGVKVAVNKETGFFQIVSPGDEFPIADNVRFADPAFRFVRPPIAHA